MKLTARGAQPDRAPCSGTAVASAACFTEGSWPASPGDDPPATSKPANVLCTPEGRVVVLDFGLAQISAQAGVEGGGSDLAGTPDYMSPGSKRRGGR